MAFELARMIASGELAAPAAYTFMEVGTAFAASVVAGGALGALVHAQPRLRRALDPLLASWYAVPFFVFYPLLVALFGLNALPLIAIGVIFAAPAMMLSTLAGLDRVPPVMRKVARVHRLSRVQEVRLITLPSAAPHLFTGLKLAFTPSHIHSSASLLANSSFPEAGSATASLMPTKVSRTVRCMRSCCSCC
jgi:NitT/TauT family transport system permease protein